MNASIVISARFSECLVPWEFMTGNDRVRWCAPCQHYVYNSECLKLDELKPLVLFKEAKLPAVFYRRPDGRLMTSSCKTATKRRSNRILASCTIVIAIGGALFLSMCMPRATCAGGQKEATAVQEQPSMRLKKEARIVAVAAAEESNGQISSSNSSSEGITIPLIAPTINLQEQPARQQSQLTAQQEQNLKQDEELIAQQEQLSGNSAQNSGISVTPEMAANSTDADSARTDNIQKTESPVYVWNAPSSPTK